MSAVQFADVIDALQARVADVARVYAPDGRLERGVWKALNPGRADGKIGSFLVHLTGPRAGKWHDFATGQHGDCLDLIQLRLGCDRAAALAEARTFLGLTAETPAQAEMRKRAAAAAKARAAREAEAEQRRVVQGRRDAQALWLSCHERIAGTPVAHYLAARGIGLDVLGRSPHAIRFHPRCRYRSVDGETGEVIEAEHPAMVTAIHGPSRVGSAPEFYGVHRTYLAQEASGRWWKLARPDAKKIFGSVKGGFIRLWSGTGPRGGIGAPLTRARAGERIVITEGIEDGLSWARLRPGDRVIAAVSLGNLREVVLPPELVDVVICADNDAGIEQARALERAFAWFGGQGRSVRCWRPDPAFKDLNAMVMAAADCGGLA